MKPLSFVAAALTTALLIPSSTAVATATPLASVNSGIPQVVLPITTTNAVMAIHPHCNMYTADKESGVTCNNPTPMAYQGKFSVRCVNMRKPTRSVTLHKSINIPAFTDTLVESVECAPGSTPVFPSFDGPYPR